MHRNHIETLSIITVLAILAGSAVLLMVTSEESEAAVGDTATLRFDDGSGNYEVFYAREGTSVELPTSLFTKNGSYLAGWRTGSSTLLPGTDYLVSGDAQFTAQWNEGNGTHLQDVVVQLGEHYSVNLWDTSPDKNGGVDNIKTPSWLGREPSDTINVYNGTPVEPGVYLVSYSKDIILGLGREDFWFTITVPSEMDDAYVIDYDFNGGTGTRPDDRVAIGTGMILPGKDATSWPDGSRTLVGWYITDVDGNRGLFPLDSLYIFDSDTTVQAAWEGNPNVLVYSLDGGSLENVYATVTWTDEPVSLRTDAVKSGYQFLGWKVTQDRELVYAPGLLTDLDSTTYLEAYFVPNGTATVTVSFDAGQGHSAIITQSVEPGKYVVLPTYQVQFDGYDFIGWSTEPPTGDGVDDDRAVIPTEHFQVTENITLYAVYHDRTPEPDPDDPEPEPDPVYFSVVFDPNGGDMTYPIQTIVEGGTASNPGEPMRDGMLFLGWALLGTSEPWDFKQPVMYDMNLYALWDEAFTISYSTSDSGLPVVTVKIDPAYVGSERIDVYWGSSMDGTETVYNGTASHTYSYTTWGYIVVTFTIDGIEHTSRMPFSVTAEHYNPTVEHTVSFDSAGGSYVEPQTVPHEGYAYRPVDPTMDGMIFDGWYFEGSEWDFSQPVVMDMVLIAHWTDEPVPDPEEPEATVAFFTMTRVTDGWLLDASKSINASGFQWMVDGLIVGEGQTFILTLDSLSDGTHTVQLVVKDQNGDSVYSGIQNITVGSTSINPIQPTASFTVTPEEDGWLLDATGSSNATRYVWYLDGEILRGESGAIVHLKSDGLADGTHTIKLTVFSNTNHTDDHSESITVSSAVEGDGPEDDWKDNIDWKLIAIVIVAVIAIAALIWRSYL